MGKTKTKNHPGLMVVLISLGCLLFFTGGRTAGFGETSEGLARIRVEEGRDFTRIVFPCDRPEDSSVEPDLDERRFSWG